MRGPEYLLSGGDLITAIDGQAIAGMDDLMTYLSERTSPKQTVEQTVLRSGDQQINLKIKLGVQPGNVRLSPTS